MATIFLASLVLGAFSGLSAGLFGIGGGLIIVPVLILLYSQHHFAPDLVMIMSVATSLATIIFTSIVSAWAHHRLHAVIWSKVYRLIPCIAVGAVGGAVIADYMPKETLRLIFIVYLLYAAIHLAIASKPKTGQKPASRTVDAFAGLIIGWLSAILGIGGGSLTVPYLVYFQMPIRNAVAVSSACGLPIAIASTLSYIALGQSVFGLPTWSLGYVYGPAFLGIVLTSVVTAPIGAKLANKLPAQQLKRYFSLLLFIMAAKLLWPYGLGLIDTISQLLHLQQ